MTDFTVDPAQRKAAKIAGFMFLLIVIGWTLNWIFVDSRLHGTGNVMAAANAIMAHELLFRIGMANELIFSISGMVLALALYSMLKPINRNLALLALCWKLMDCRNRDRQCARRFHYAADVEWKSISDGI